MSAIQFLLAECAVGLVTLAVICFVLHRFASGAQFDSRSWWDESEAMADTYVPVTDGAEPENRPDNSDWWRRGENTVTILPVDAEIEA